MEVDDNGEQQVEDDDLAGHVRPTVGLGVLEQIGGNRSVDGERGEHEARQVREHVEQKGVHATQDERLVAEYDAKVVEADEIAEADDDDDQVEDGQEGHVYKPKKH